jgi:hypothetical protein
MSLPYFGGFDIHAAVLIVLSGALALSAVRVLDLNVYHKMLRGAVTFGEDFEENYMKHIFRLEKGMTQAISHYSRHQDADVDKTGTSYHYTGIDKKDAFKKIKRFYNLSTWTIVAAAALLFAITGHFGHPTFPKSLPASTPQGSNPVLPHQSAPPTVAPNQAAPVGTKRM